MFVSNGTLKSEEKSQDARFGYALAAAPDLNHDGFTDLLVGAPLEDEHRGAIYVYHGEGIYIIHNYKQVFDILPTITFSQVYFGISIKLISASASQRIPGSSISPSLQYFGRSVSARLDLDGDELIDLAVGAQGSAVLLRWVEAELGRDGGALPGQILFHSCKNWEITKLQNRLNTLHIASWFPHSVTQRIQKNVNFRCRFKSSGFCIFVVSHG